MAGDDDVDARHRLGQLIVLPFPLSVPLWERQMVKSGWTFSSSSATTRLAASAMGSNSISDMGAHSSASTPSTPNTAIFKPSRSMMV